MNAHILNRNAQPPTDGWFQIEVTGEWPAGTFPDGRQRRQLIDATALDAIVNRFAQDKAAAGDSWTGILVDKDHLSHDLENETEAMAWLQEVAVRPDEKGIPQLWGRLDLSDIGTAAVMNRRYKRFSTEYDPDDLEDLGEGIVRPRRLSGLAFTNRPNNRGGKPISNRDGTRPPGETTPNHETTDTMKSIAEKLGLSAEATEADILSAIESLQKKVSDMETKDAEAQADAVLNRLGDRVPEAARQHWRTQLITNREAAEKLMEASFPEKKESKPAESIFNRAQAKAPAPVENQQNAENPEAAKKAAAIRNRAGEISKNERIPFNQAFARATAELS